MDGASTATGGGGLYLFGGVTSTITNTLITGNRLHTTDWRYGGGISNSGPLTLMNSTVSGNYAYREGGGLYANGTETITNSIIWDNIADLGSADSIYGTAETVTYSDIEGSYSGTGNLDLDPNFVTPAQANSGSATSAGDFHIQSGSNVIDQVTATGSPADDIDGDGRPLGSGIDMGADEKE